MSSVKRRSARQRAERKRSIYHEPDSDDFEEADGGDSEHEYQPEAEAAGPSQPQRSRKRRKTSRRAKPETRAATKRKDRFKPRPLGWMKKRRGNTGSAAGDKSKEDTGRKFTGPSDGKIPDWTALPAEVLRNIFIFASQPMQEQTMTAKSNATWLIRAARTCRAFAVPALEAYYESPLLHTSLQPHNLLDLVKAPQESLYMSYKYRIKSVVVDITRLVYVAHNKRPFQISGLLEELPRLQHLEIVHPIDSPPYRLQYKCQRWEYPIEFVQSLDAAGSRLRTFRWTRDMVPVQMTNDLSNMYSWMTQVHLSKSFEYLERLVVCGFDFKNSALEPPDEASARPHALATTISALQHLKDLTLISCDIVMEDFLEHIPNNLQRLELSNCLEVTSELLLNYLATGGSQLRELVLNHNAALSLAFLQQLRALCPRLEVLKMDLTYYSERITFNDAIAFYDHLLTDDQVPTWPSTLRHLELIHLQKWEAEAAQNLFRSLVEGAKDLPDLRHLVIHAHINIPWRDRAGFRDQWIERLHRVYLRKNEEPNPNLGSLRQFRFWREAVHRDRDAERMDVTPSSASRKFSHIRITPRKMPADAAAYSDVESPEPTSARRGPRRSTRVAESQSASTAEEESTSSSEEESDGDWHKQPESFIQGLCDKVEISIDNQRPRENQYTEANFLDSEPSGDEDWREGADVSDDERYAW